MKINKKDALKLAKLNNINLDVVRLEQWIYGLNIELEHHDITHNNEDITAKIVIAHLKEDPFYYYRLQKLEDESNQYWKNKTKPNIFN